MWYDCIGSCLLSCSIFSRFDMDAIGSFLLVLFTLTCSNKDVYFLTRFLACCLRSYSILSRIVKDSIGFCSGSCTMLYDFQESCRISYDLVYNTVGSFPEVSRIDRMLLRGVWKSRNPESRTGTGTETGTVTRT